MSLFLTFVALGLVNWFGTLLVVESKFFEPVRNRATKLFNWNMLRLFEAKRKWSQSFWGFLLHFTRGLDFMIGCHMCAGTWVALALAAWAPPVFGANFFGYILVALLIKAIGHLILTLWAVGDKRAKLDEAKARQPAPQGYEEFMRSE